MQGTALCLGGSPTLFKLLSHLAKTCTFFFDFACFSFVIDCKKRNVFGGSPCIAKEQNQYRASSDGRQMTHVGASPKCGREWEQADKWPVCPSPLLTWVLSSGAAGRETEAKHCAVGCQHSGQEDRQGRQAATGTTSHKAGQLNLVFSVKLFYFNLPPPLLLQRPHRCCRQYQG